MTKKELTHELLVMYRQKNYKLALAAKRKDAAGILKAKIELHYLLNTVVPMVLGYNSKFSKQFRQEALKILEEQRKTKEELKVEYVI